MSQSGINLLIKQCVEKLMDGEPNELEDDEPYLEVVSKEEFIEKAEETSNRDEEE